MTLPLPYRHAIRPDGSMQLEWDVKTFPDQQHDGAYYVRGGICFPVLNEITGEAIGHAIAAAQRISTGRLFIFSDTPFVCIDHATEPDGRIRTEGLAPWFNWAWSKLGLNYYYFRHGDDVDMLYRRVAWRSQMIQPTPQFQELIVSDPNDAINTLYFWYGQGRIVIDADSAVQKQFLLWEGSGRKAVIPSVVAFANLIVGLERFRFMPVEGDGL